MPYGTPQASQAKFAAILDIAADAIITVDGDRRILHFNKGAEEIFGYAAAEMIGQPLELLIPERFRAAHPRHVQEFGESAEPARRMGHRREVSGLRKDGREFPAEASISKLDTDQGRIYTAVVRDVSERHEAEARERFLAGAGQVLSESLEHEEVVRAVLTHAVPQLGAGCVLDLAGDGETLRRLTHAAAPELAGTLQQLLAYAITTDSPSAAIDVMRRRAPAWVEPLDEDWIEAHEETQEAVALWKDTGAESLWILPLAVGGRAFGALTLVRRGNDTNTPETRALAAAFAERASLALENARLYQAARRATRARDEVLGVVSHDLRNPLSAIAMCAEALREGTPGTPDAQTRDELLGAIVEATEWAQRLIRDLLDVSALDAGGLALERAPVPLSEIVSRATSMLESDFAGRRVALTTQVANPDAIVHADADRMVQVIANLLGNAAKFTETGGRVMVRARTEGSHAVVSVEDTGRGIPRDEQARIFDRYWQSRRGASRRGSGLGLAIAKGIVEAHGGTVGVESEPGRGSTFTVRFPRGAS